MKVKELMERVGINETGRAVAYVKDGLEELNVIFETHCKTQRIDITEGQRFYDFPNDMVKVIDIRMKNHFNDKDEYRSIPRMLHKPIIKDEDGF
tara:strand:+ start:3188 stop:3469 length:282 start_codon:yes stop_codon:yes gene_type:complete